MPIRFSDAPAPPEAGYMSVCCESPVMVTGRTTRYYVCLTCNSACDAVPV